MPHAAGAPRATLSDVGPLNGTARPDEPHAGDTCAQRLKGTVWQYFPFAAIACRSCTRFAVAAGRLGVPADAFTYLSLVLAGAAGAAAASGWLATGGLLVLVSGGCDLCDGTVARATGTSSSWGALLDSTVDRLSEGLPLVGVAVFYAGDGAHVSVPVLAALAGYSVSYTRARSEGLGLELPPLFMRRAERVVLVALSLLAGVLPIRGAHARAPLTLVGLALVATASFVALLAAMRAARRASRSAGALGASWGGASPELLRTVIHEVNNSLALVSMAAGRARLVSDYLERDRDVSQAFDAIEERARHLQAFLTTCARVARLPACQPSWVDCRALLQQLGILLPGIRPSITPVSALGWFDRVQIEQVLLNLVTNASEAGGTTVDVRVHVEQDGTTRVEVADDGPGFSAAALASAFSVAGSTKREGRGLGLWLCRVIIDGHGGRVDVRNVDPHGALVTFELPGNGAGPPSGRPSHARPQS